MAITPAPAHLLGRNPANLVNLFQQSQLVADVVLLKRSSHVPAPLRIIVTDYEFHILEKINGEEATRVTVRNEGGELIDNTGMVTVGSYKLRVGHRYLIFARATEVGLRLTHVLGVEYGGAVLATPEGHAIIDVHDGELSTTREQYFRPLRYLPSIPRPEPTREGPPDHGSFPVAPEPKADEPPSLITIEQLKCKLREILTGQSSECQSSTPPLNKCELPVFLTHENIVGGYVDQHISFYTNLAGYYEFKWFGECLGNWNRLFNPSALVKVFGYQRDSEGLPARSEFPVANNNRNNVGLMTSADMAAGGYDTWETLNAIGVAYVWYETPSGRVTGCDALIKSEVITDEALYRQAMVHELGHCLMMGHEDRYVSIMYPTGPQPPLHDSHAYSAAHDHDNAFRMFRWVNDNIEPQDRWALHGFIDLATYSHCHSNPGTSGNLTMATISNSNLIPGEIAMIRNVHVENRGSRKAKDVKLKFYLSPDPTPAGSDTGIEIASYEWEEFEPFAFASLPFVVRIPESTPLGTYYVRWIVTTGGLAESGGGGNNNTALLRKGGTPDFPFPPQTVTVR
jgi:hypothetical protein